jgi:hypothetical protein
MAEGGELAQRRRGLRPWEEPRVIVHVRLAPEFADALLQHDDERVHLGTHTGLDAKAEVEPPALAGRGSIDAVDA